MHPISIVLFIITCTVYSKFWTSVQDMQNRTLPQETGRFRSSNIECASRCNERPNCLSLFYKYDESECYLYDTVYDVNSSFTTAYGEYYVVLNSVTSAVKGEPRNNTTDQPPANTTINCTVPTYTLSSDFCYRVFEQNLSWYYARNECNGDSADLAIIDSQWKLDIFGTYHQSGANEYYIGMHNIYPNGSFENIDGTSTNPGNFSKRSPNRETGDGQCGFLSYEDADGKYVWDATLCDTPKYFICEQR